MELENEMSAITAKEISDQIDWEIMASVRLSIGWTATTSKQAKYSPDDSHEILNWVQDYCKGKYASHAEQWIFEKQQDAVLFTLRWG